MENILICWLITSIAPDGRRLPAARYPGRGNGILAVLDMAAFWGW